MNLQQYIKLFTVVKIFIHIFIQIPFIQSIIQFFIQSFMQLHTQIHSYSKTQLQPFNKLINTVNIKLLHQSQPIDQFQDQSKIHYLPTPDIPKVEIYTAYPGKLCLWYGYERHEMQIAKIFIFLSRGLKPSYVLVYNTGILIAIEAFQVQQLCLKPRLFCRQMPEAWL